MRPILATLFCALVAVPAALAAPAATGDGVLQLQNVYGRVQIGSLSQPAKGILWGQIDSGTVQTIDPVSGDGKILVSGWDSRNVIPADSTTNPPTPSKTIYKGTSGMHFRVTGGTYKLVLSGSNISLTAIGVGAAALSGSTNADDPGTYEVDSGDWLSVPTTGSRTVLFGAQPTPGP